MKGITAIALFTLLISAPAYCGQETDPSLQEVIYRLKDSDKQLSDADIKGYASSSYDKDEMMFKKFRLGYHNGKAVIVSFPCSDLCPDYTTRLIYYDVELDKCSEMGGKIKELFVPESPQDFCVPPVLSESKEDSGEFQFEYH